jgi:hypothetical protein
VRELAEMVGSDGLGDDDRRYLRCTEAFEARLAAQGQDEERGLERTLELAWEVLALLPRSELIRIRPELVSRHLGGETGADAPATTTGWVGTNLARAQAGDRRPRGPPARPEARALLLEERRLAGEAAEAAIEWERAIRVEERWAVRSSVLDGQRQVELVRAHTRLRAGVEVRCGGAGWA